MNPELILIGALGFAFGVAGTSAILPIVRWLKRRRQPQKPWRKAEGPAFDPVQNRVRTKASAGKAPVRKRKARIGGHRRLNR